jgi:hypothetical protein
MAQPLSVASDRGDPRLHEKERDAIDAIDYGTGLDGAVRPQHRKLHDPNVTFEEYYYYAKLTRAEEENHPNNDKERGWLSILIPSKSDGGVKPVSVNMTEDAKTLNGADAQGSMGISDEEWTNASRALRTATRGAIFYLITTDILGPFGLGFAFATMGWG